ncbi:MAG: ParB N-terminal domain-containing protein [Chloroflexi bacterium]|nr:ParB N-terminal domain-containing protein [Chloroflexota bacterium]
MAKRKSALASLDFKRVDPLGLGEGQAVTTGAAIAATYHIESMLPDPDQPRALLPESLAEQVNNGQIAPMDAILEWERLAAMAGPDSPEAHLLEKVKELAEAIAEHGLINPITIRLLNDDDPVEDIEYRIVTGERRWWAHVYLAAKERHIQEGNERQTATQIKATLTPEGARIRAHQLVENWFREDISVVEKAYGLWGLRCEMSGLPFGNYDERDLVNWQDVEALLNIGRRQRRRIVRILELTEEAQAIINGHRLSERSVRPMAMKLVNYPELQIEALNQVISWIATGQGHGEKQVAKLVDTLLAREAAKRGDAVSVEPPLQFQAKKFRSRVRSALKLVSDLDTASWGEAVDAVTVDEDLATELRQLRSVIDQLLPD